MPTLLVQDQMRAFLAPYADSLKQLGSKTAGLQGYPLKTSVRILFGGRALRGRQEPAASGGSDNTVADAGQAAGNAAASSGIERRGLRGRQRRGNAAGNNAGRLGARARPRAPSAASW